LIDEEENHLRQLILQGRTAPLHRQKQFGFVLNADVCSAATNPRVRNSIKCSVRTPQETPDALIHQAGVRAHWIVTGVLDAYNG